MEPTIPSSDAEGRMRAGSQPLDQPCWFPPPRGHYHECAERDPEFTMLSNYPLTGNHAQATAGAVPTSMGRFGDGARGLAPVRPGPGGCAA